MNRRRIAVVAVVIGLTGVAGALGAFGLSAPGAPGAADTTPTADATPTADEPANHTRIVSTTRNLTFAAAEGQVVRGETSLAPGTELTVRVRSTAPGAPFLRSSEATVADDGTFRATVDLSVASPGNEARVLVLREGRELANATAAIETPDRGTALSYGGDAVALAAGPDQAVNGTTDLDPGTELAVRLHGSGEQAFIRQATATVADDGTFGASFDLSGLDPGARFRVSVVRDGDRLAYAPGDISGEAVDATPTEGPEGVAIEYEGDALALRNASGQLVSGTADLDPGTEVQIRLRSTRGQAFLRQTTATVGPEGTFEASFNLSTIDSGTEFEASVVRDGDSVAAAPGEVVASG